MYLLEPSALSRRAAGKQVLVRETHEGDVVIEVKGIALPARAFVKDARVAQGAIADNKVLGALLADVQRQQFERDAFQTKRLTLREEDIKLKAMGETGLPTRREAGRPTIRELALRRIAAEAAVGGGQVDRLIAQTVERLAQAPIESSGTATKKKRRRRPAAQATDRDLRDLTAV